MSPSPASPAQVPLLPTRQVLLIEDEALFARAVTRRLERAGFAVAVAGLLREGLELAEDLQPDLILLDLRLPDGDGLTSLPQLSRNREGGPVAVIVLTAFGEVEDAVSAMKQGAADYLKKPIDLDELMLAVEGVLRSAGLRDRLDFSRERDSRALESATLIGESPVLLELKSRIKQIAQLSSPGLTPPSVLIQGETGSGKDVVARLLHQASANHAAPFVHVDCAALPRDLIEAELFGHEKGAYTSAVGARAGLIEAAEDGTLFLDEIGELPLDLQAKLLAVIERRRVRRVGSVRERPVAARFISASNRDLLRMSEDGTFRSDLYYRLNVLSIALPPLRERGDDVLLLARHYAGLTARRYGLRDPGFGTEALAALRRYRWPGNVRELRNLVERAVLLSAGQAINAAVLALPADGPTGGPAALAPVPAESLLELTLAEAEQRLIVHALQAAEGNISEAARRLGVTRMTLRYRMNKYRLGGDPLELEDLGELE
jgi:DNA-binding NtrC family response regulator